jgi:hypothetical protein
MTELRRDRFKPWPKSASRLRLISFCTSASGETSSRQDPSAWVHSAAAGSWLTSRAHAVAGTAGGESGKMRARTVTGTAEAVSGDTLQLSSGRAPPEESWSVSWLPADAGVQRKRSDGTTEASELSGGGVAARLEAGQL